MRGVNKYGNRKTEIDGIMFASAKEARRYVELKLLVRAKDITDLELQPSFALVVNGVKIGKYLADFRYQRDGQTIIEDVKGMKTPVYNLKKRLMKAIHNIEITEV